MSLAAVYSTSSSVPSTAATLAVTPAADVTPSFLSDIGSERNVDMGTPVSVGVGMTPESHSEFGLFGMLGGDDGLRDLLLNEDDSFNTSLFGPEPAQ